MEILIDPDFSEDEQQKPTSIIKRPKWKRKYLLKMYTIREILKWKHNYFEATPREHSLFKHYQHIARSTKSRRFKQAWRVQMDDCFYLECSRNKELLLKQTLKALNGLEVKDNEEERRPMIDVPRLLADYDFDIASMLIRVRNEYRHYLNFPKSCVRFREEAKNFLKMYDLENFDKILPDYRDVDDEFLKYWAQRCSTMCEEKIIEEKSRIRKDWEELLPPHQLSGIGVVYLDETESQPLMDYDELDDYELDDYESKDN